jgi:type VI secretion system protein ImpK
MSDNPFAEPEDDRTVFRPMPGGQRAAARVAPRPASPPPSPDSRPPEPRRAEPPPILPGADLQTLVAAFANPLIAAAAPLLQLLARLRNTAAPPDQGDMRDRTAREMREFERRAREAGVPMEQVRPAHYALCASLDDVVLNTPWGAHGRWKERTLSATFHGDTGAGEGFFDQIRLMRQDPAKHLPVLELMYLCMALGFMGPFRTAPDGAERMDRIRAQTYDLIAQARGESRGGPPPRLSEHWEGVDAAYQPRRTRFPVWVAACAAIAAVAGGFVWVLNGVNRGSDQFLEAALAAPPASMPQIARPPSVRPPPPPPEPPPPGSADRLRAALAAEIGKHELEVVAMPSATILRLPVKLLFPGPSAVLAKGSQVLLERVGQALKSEPGAIRVLGYSDNTPIRNVKFPSNFALSQARAETVRDSLSKPIGDPKRLAAEGRADADPVAPNNTAEGREQNRRIDIVLPR